MSFVPCRTIFELHVLTPEIHQKIAPSNRSEYTFWTKHVQTISNDHKSGLSVEIKTGKAQVHNRVLPMYCLCIHTNFYFSRATFVT